MSNTRNKTENYTKTRSNGLPRKTLIVDFNNYRDVPNEDVESNNENLCVEKKAQSIINPENTSGLFETKQVEKKPTSTDKLIKKYSLPVPSFIPAAVIQSHIKFFENQAKKNYLRKNVLLKNTYEKAEGLKADQIVKQCKQLLCSLEADDYIAYQHRYK